MPTSVIGVIGRVIGIYRFFDTLFGGTGGNFANVRVAASLNGNGDSTNGDGSIGSICIYKENQQILSKTGGGYISSGGFKDFKLPQIKGQKATYIQLYATADAICIPYMTVTWADKGKYGWVGDFGGTCGLEWYYSNVYVDNSGNKPRCTWIDSDRTNNIRSNMLMIHMPSFAGGKSHSSNPTSYCGYPALRAYDNTGAPILKMKRSVARALDSRLVISSDPSHNATILCESEISRGPDLVSLVEGVYCNMETSETLPLCTGRTTTNCFHLDGNANVKRDGSVLRSPTLILSSGIKCQNLASRASKTWLGENHSSCDLTDGVISGSVQSAFKLQNICGLSVFDGSSSCVFAMSLSKYVF